MRDDFAVFILTHGRANDQKTYKLLQKSGYTGKIYLICDNEDEQLEEYQQIYGDGVLVFDKKEWAKKVDTADNFGNMKSVVYARNASFDIAQKLGLTYFAMFDDDLTVLRYRFVKCGQFKSESVKNFDALVGIFLEFLELDSIASLRFGTQRCYIGGMKSQQFQKRLILNFNQAAFVKANDKLSFRGLLNEDLHVQYDCGLMGKFNFCYTGVMQIAQERTTNAGGLQELYKEFNSYVTVFYSVIVAPSCFEIKFAKGKFDVKRNDDKMAPKIISERWKK